MTTYALPISEGLAARLASLSPEKMNAVNAEITELIVDILEEQEPRGETSSADPLVVADIRRAIEMGIDKDTISLEELAQSLGVTVKTL